ncbi:MAG: hypothetical protein HRU34_10900 [Richelia sp.]|nr:hypothetical protein [Richelia sp.]
MINTITGHNNTVKYALSHPKGQTIISVSTDKTIRLWKLEKK